MDHAPAAACTRSRLRTALPLSALIAFLAVLYYGGITGPFTFDDTLVFPSTQLPSLDREQILRTLAMHESGIFGRPVTILSFILNHHVLGPEPAGYKAVNLALHALNAALVFLFVRTLLRTMAEQGRLSAPTGRAEATALIVCALWALHPLQVSTVLYVFQRTMLLSTMFTLIALLLFVTARGDMARRGTGHLRLFLLFPIALALATISKENGALIVLYVSLIELIAFRRPAEPGTERRATRAFFLAYVVLPTLAAALFFLLKTDVILEGYASRDFTMADRLRTEAVAILFYLKLIVLPDLSDMSLYHDAFTRYREMGPKVLLAFSALILMAVAAAALHRRTPLLSLGIGLFLLAHALESTFIPLELVFEHRNYFALLGVALPVGWALTGLCRQARPQVGTVLLLLPCLFLSAQTVARVVEWSDELTLNALAVENRPESPRARMLYIRTLSNLGRHDEALERLDEALTDFGDRASYHVFSLAVLCNAGRPVADELARVRHVLTAYPLDQDVPRGLHTLMQMKGAGSCERPDFDDLDSLFTAAASNDEHRMPSAFLANLLSLHAQFRFRSGDNSTAVSALRRALEVSPGNAQVMIALASVQIAAGRLVDAASTADQLASINRKTAGAYSTAVQDLKGRIARARDASLAPPSAAARAVR